MIHCVSVTGLAFMMKGSVPILPDDAPLSIEYCQTDSSDRRTRLALNIDSHPPRRRREAGSVTLPIARARASDRGEVSHLDL
jgi:hypothetical protein